MTNRKFLTAALTVVTALLLVGCGSTSATTTTPQTIPADVTLTVYAGPGLKFDKTEYTVAAGKVTIAYVNRDAMRHTLAVITDKKVVLPGELMVGKSGDVAVGSWDLTPGTYRLQCLVPGHDAMRATLTVTG